MQTIAPNPRLLETPPEAVRTVLTDRLPAGEEVLIQVVTDLTAERAYGAQWIVVTAERVIIVPVEGNDATVEVAVDKIKLARTEPLVGGGRLEIEQEAAATRLLPYSGSLSGKFSEVARGIEQLRKGEPFFINAKLDRTRCEKCDRLLPEKNGICPACIRKLATLKRIASFMVPYKGRAAILAIASVATTVAALMPPLVTRHLSTMSWRLWWAAISRLKTVTICWVCWYWHWSGSGSGVGAPSWCTIGWCRGSELG